MSVVDLMDAPLGEPVDWDAVAAALPWAQEMRACLQDPVFHAEGDVWTHTVMVAEALRSSPEFGSLDAFRRRTLLAAALLHDVAKPATRTEELDPDVGRLRVRHPSHAAKGARMAHRFLWEAGEGGDFRERVFSLVMAHQKVFHLLSAGDPREEAIRQSLVLPWTDLLALAQADNAGRISPNLEETRDELDCVRLYVEELGIADRAWPFASDAARVYFCRERGRSPFFDPQPPSGSRVVVLSGMPGSGKDTYADRALGSLPQVSPDAIRKRLAIAWTDEQGAVVQAALEEARGHLRAGRDFVWNATHLSRKVRDKAVSLCLDYGATVEIHVLDTPRELARKRNRGREARVPEAAWEAMAGKWEPATPLEAHKVVRVGPDLAPVAAYRLDEGSIDPSIAMP